MNARFLRKLSLFSILLCHTIFCIGQDEAQYIRTIVNGINNDIEEVHQLSSQRRMYDAIAKLDKIYFKLNEERRKGTFDEMYKAAKRKNPSFTYTIRKDLPPQLGAAYWKSKLAQCQRILANQEVVIEGMRAARRFNNEEKFIALVKQLKTGYDAVKGIIENAGTANFIKLGYDLHGNFNDAIENYKAYEAADLKNLELDVKMAMFKLTIAKAEKNKTSFTHIQKYIKDNYDAVVDFKINVDYLNKIKSSIDSGPIDKMNFTDNKYNWNYEDFQDEVEELCKDFEEYESSCADFRKAYNEINTRARRDWTKIKGNINNSDDAAKKQEFLRYHNERWTEYLGVVDPIFSRVYNEFCGANATKKKEDKPKAEKKEEAKDEDKDKPQPDTQGLFAGSKIKKKVEPEKKEPEKEPEKKKKKKSKSSSKPRYGKYWETTLPANTETDWYGYVSRIQVRHKLDGRTICYQMYFDAGMKYLHAEVFHDNFAMQHGPYRRFNQDAASKKVYLELTGYYRMDKSVGPWVSYLADGTINKVEYYIDGQKVDVLQYKNKLNSDNTLPPLDCYKNYDWHARTNVELDNEPDIISIEDFNEYGLSFPDRLGIIRTVREQQLKGVGTENEHIYYAEHLYSKNGIFQELGTWYWYYRPDGMKAHVQTIKFGNLQIRRSSYNKDGTAKSLWFIINNDISGTGNASSSAPFKKIGPYAKNEEGQISVKYYDGQDNVISKAAYTKIYEANTYLPHPDIHLRAGAFKYPKYKKYDMLEKTSLSSSLVKFGRDDEIWKARVNHQSGEFRIDMFRDHRNAGSIEWYDYDRTQIKSASFFKGFYYGYKNWYKNGQIKSSSVRPQVGQTFYKRWNEQGEITKVSEPSKHQERYEDYLPEYEYPEVSDAILKSVPDFEIPEEEITPLFEAFIESLKNPDASNYNQMLSEGIKNDDSTPQTKESTPDFSRTGDSDQNNDQAAINAEFTKIMDEVNRITEQADASFNKKYWESNANQNARNPKQEAFEILKRAIPIIDRAKYPGPKFMAYHFLAMKFTDYSGRVFAYTAKQDFFAEAAKLSIKADDLLPRLRSMGKQALSEMYVANAENWRNMTRKALWGDHAYNKMECDKKVLLNYERAVQTDPNNLKAKRMLEKLKAPKKAVPAPIQRVEEIPDMVWNAAQEDVVYMQDPSSIEEMGRMPTNYSEVATMTLEIGRGKVSIRRVGAKNWSVITDQHIQIFVGDRIKTSSDASGVSVTYAIDETFLAIKPDSEVEFQESQLNIWRGGSFLNVVKKGNKFVVVTPTYAVGVRGTQFEVGVNTDKSTTTYLYEGLIETRNGSDIAYLEAGDKLEAKQGDAKLNVENFDARSRKAREWRNVQSQQTKHDQVRRTVTPTKPAMSTSPNTSNQTSSGKRGTFSNTTNKKNPFAGSGSKVIEDRKPRVDQRPKTTVSKSTISKSGMDISSSPDGSFLNVLVKKEFNYGIHALASRCYANFRSGQQVEVKWYFNQNQLLYSDNARIDKNENHFDASILSSENPLTPGEYTAVYSVSGREVGRSSITIKQPVQLSADGAQSYYVGAINMIGSALNYLNEGNYENAARVTKSASSGLVKALYNSPQLPDIWAVHLTAESILALNEVEKAGNANKLNEAREWTLVALSNIILAHDICADAQFKQTLAGLKTVIETIYIELNQ